MSEVKRWMVDTWHFHAKAPDLPTSSPVAVVLASAYDALKLARDTAEDRIVDLGNRLLKAEAERDKLAATVERVRAVTSRHKHSEYAIALLCELGTALAEPVEETFQRLNSFGVPYESRNGRGLIGHDARGRRHEDTHVCMRYTPLTWDQRRAQRRKA